MLAAKLFATLTILHVGLALLESETRRSIDIHIHDTYFVIPGFLLQIVLALVSGFFGLVYFAASRWVSHPLNNSLGLTHFALVTIGYVLLWVFLSAPGSAAGTGSMAVPAIKHWTFCAATLGLLSSLLGCTILALNCGLTAIRAFQRHKG